MRTTQLLRLRTNVLQVSQTNKPKTLTVAETPFEDRPRERLMAVGAENLRLAELLAILIRVGRPGESAMQAGEKLAAKYSSSLEKMPEAQLPELKQIAKSVAKSAYCQLMAGIEIGRRVAESKLERNDKHRISSTDDAKNFCEDRFARLVADGKREEFHIVTLDTKNRVIDTHQVSVGTLDASLVHPREVFRPAVKDAASSIILVHNHPSGDPTPSREDFAVTRRLEEAGQNLGIDVLDHIVLGSFRSISVREA